LHQDRFLALLACDHYQKVVALEMHPNALDAGKSNDRVMELMAASLEQCRA
jgi:alpha/beta superfamily hydrolase